MYQQYQKMKQCTKPNTPKE